MKTGNLIVKRHMARCLTMPITSDMLIKPTVRYHLTPVRMVLIKKKSTNNEWKKLLCIACVLGNLTLCDPKDCNPLAPLSIGFSRQEYWNGLPFLFPGDLPYSGIGPLSPALAGGFFTAEAPKPLGKCWGGCGEKRIL